MSREWNTVLSSPLHKNHEVQQLIHSIFKNKCMTIQQASTHSSVTERYCYAHRCNFPTAGHWLPFSPEVNITCSLNTWDQTGLRVSSPPLGTWQSKTLWTQYKLHFIHRRQPHLWSELINMYICICVRPHSHTLTVCKIIIM